MPPPPAPNKVTKTGKATSKYKLVTRRATRDSLKRVRQELDRVMRSIPDIFDIEDALKLLGEKLDKLQIEMEDLGERMNYVEDHIDIIRAAGMESKIENLDEKLSLLDEEVTNLKGLKSILDKADGPAAGTDGQGA